MKDKNSNNANRLLIMDDDPDVSKFLSAVAMKQGFATRRIDNAAALVAALSEFQPTIIALDLQMPDIDGVQVLRTLADERCVARIVIISGVDARTLVSVEQLGASLGLEMLGHLQKPILVEDFRAALRQGQSDSQPISREELAAGIRNGELYVEFQPIAVRHAGDDWRIEGVESLVRWRRNGETVSPGELVPLAESWGLLPELTQHVIEETLLQLRELEDAGVRIGASINIAPCTLVSTRFPDVLESVVRAHGFDNSRITLEMTETSVMNRGDLGSEILSRLRIKDFGLAIDDFGTGYSSLQQLYRLPFNELKIDTSFVLDMLERPDAKTIVEASIWLAHKMGMQVCAEGVETRAAFDLLAELGCDRIQGYLIGRPSEPRTVPEKISSWQEMAA